MSVPKNRKPTDSEMEILDVLWNKASATVREVHEELSKHKDAGYTTTLKLMQIMHEKKLLHRNDNQKTHIYQPAISRESVQQQSLRSMIAGLFSGSSTGLVIQALGQQPVSEAELDEIEKYISSLRNKSNL